MWDIVRALSGRTIIHGRRSAARREQAKRWQAKWSNEEFDPRWMSRDVSPEVVESAASGWFPAGGTVLDIGCGEGQLAAWMASKGFPSVGVDIAPAAIARARTRFPEKPGQLEFFAADVRSQPPPDRQYSVLIDRGCFHLMRPRDYGDLLNNLLGVSAPHARMLLLHRAFREEGSMDDPAERERAQARVAACFGTAFRIVRSADTFLDKFGGEQPERAIRGIAFWMERR